MKFKKQYKYYFYNLFFLLGILISVNAFSMEKIDIKFIPSCGKTRGGVAIAVPPNIIYYCAQRISKIEWYFPNVTDFFFIHEIMHLEHNSGDEQLVDCLSARELQNYKNGNKIISQVIKFIESRPFVDSNHGGSGAKRAKIISECYKQGLKFLEIPDTE